MTLLTQQQKFGTFIPWVASLLALLAVWFILLPKLEVIRQTQTELTTLRAQVEAKTKELDSLRKLATQGGAVARTLELLAVAAPADPQIPELLIMVEAIASKSGLTLVNATPSVSTSGTKLDLSLKGGYGSMASFFDLLNRNLRPAKVNNFSEVSQAAAPGETAETILSVGLEFVGGVTKLPERAPAAQAGEEMVP